MDIFKVGSNGFMDGFQPDGAQSGIRPKSSRSSKQRAWQRARIALMAIPALKLATMAAKRRRKQQQASEIGPGTTDHDMKGVYTTGIDEIVGMWSDVPGVKRIPGKRGFHLIDPQDPRVVRMRRYPGKKDLIMPLPGETGPIMRRVSWARDIFAPIPGHIGPVMRVVNGNMLIPIPGTLEDLRDEELARTSEVKGIDEIVGQARAARARRGQGVSPMMSPVPGLVARKPRVEIIDMPEMRISRGSVSPAMPNISPQLAMLLRQIHGGTQTLRADGAAVRRQRPVWPGARGRYPY